MPCSKGGEALALSSGILSVVPEHGSGPTRATDVRSVTYPIALPGSATPMDAVATTVARPLASNTPVSSATVPARAAVGPAGQAPGGNRAEAAALEAAAVVSRRLP